MLHSESKMILTLKNKMLMAFDKMIDEANKYGGNPNQIILSPNEAVQFLKEMRDNLESRIHVDVNKNNVAMITLKIWRDDNVTSREINDVVREWYAKEYTFHFKHVELIVAKPTKQSKEVPEEANRTPIKSFNCWGDISSNHDYD